MYIGTYIHTYVTNLTPSDVTAVINAWRASHLCNDSAVLKLQKRSRCGSAEEWCENKRKLKDPGFASRTSRGSNRLLIKLMLLKYNEDKIRWPSRSGTVIYLEPKTFLIRDPKPCHVHIPERLAFQRTMVYSPFTRGIFMILLISLPKMAEKILAYEIQLTCTQESSLKYISCHF
jgi:hypothetical protein